MFSIQFGSHTIPYTLAWSKRRKSIAIAVDSSGVHVIAPTNTSHEKINETVYKKATWIRAQLMHFEEMKDSEQHRLFLAGEKLPYLGRHYRLKIEKNESIESSSLSFLHGTFIGRLPVVVPNEQHREILFPLYEQWIKEKGEAFIKQRLHRFTVKLQAEPTAIKIKVQEQRWGSCTAKGEVLLNWRIFLASVSIVDYVLAHELAHLKHMNHSVEYWETLRMLLADYEERKEWLRVNGRTLYI